MNTQEILNSLQDIDGYLASAYFETETNNLTKHSDSTYDIEIIISDIVTMINLSIMTVNNAILGELQFIQLNFDLGILSVAWHLEKKSIAMVLLETKGNVGLAKLALTKLIETV